MNDNLGGRLLVFIANLAVSPTHFELLAAVNQPVGIEWFPTIFDHF